MSEKQRYIWFLIIIIFLLLIAIKQVSKFSPHSQFSIGDVHSEKGCSEIGCLKVNNGDDIKFQPNSFVIKGSFENAKNIFFIAENISRFRVTLSSTAGMNYSVGIVPEYQAQNIYKEIQKTMDVLLVFPIDSFLEGDSYSLTLNYNNLSMGNISFRTKTNTEWYAGIIPKNLMFITSKINSLFLLFSMIIFMTSYFLELYLCSKNNVSNEQFFYLQIIRAVLFAFISCLLLFKQKGNASEYFSWMFVIIVMLLPWGALKTIRLNVSRVVEISRKFLTAEPDDCMKNKKVDNNSVMRVDNHLKYFNEGSPLWVIISIISMIIFFFALSAYDSFQWSIFEERDFLIAREVSKFRYFPTLGPQLISGGQTPGGFLYVFLSPFTMLDTPVVFSIVNKILFFLSAIMLCLILNKYVGKVAVAIGSILFCTSTVVIGFAYWPIHPSMTIFFYLLFIFALLRGFIDGSKIAVILSGLILSVLVQFHFSFYLLVFTYIIAFLVFRRNLALSVRTFLFSLAAFLVPLIPYVATEILDGFPNARLISQKPRFHPDYAGFGDSSQFELSQVIDRTLEWLLGYGNGFNIAFVNIMHILLFFIGLLVLCIVIAKIVKWEINKTEVLFIQIVFMLFIVPLCILLIMKMGYSVRHTISFAPGLFIITAVGISWLVKRGPRYVSVAAVLMCLLLQVLSISTIAKENKEENIKRSAQIVSEWAVDYKTQQSLLRVLARDLGVTQEQYRNKVYWWWLGYAASPEMYQNVIQMANLKNTQISSWLDKPDSRIFFFLYTKINIESTIFPEIFEINRIATDSGVLKDIFMARIKDFKGAYPQGNTVNRARLNELEHGIENYKLGEEGLFSVNSQNNNGQKKSYLLSLQKSRIRLLINLKEVKGANNTIIQWEIESPHLNGYYQEIKTIWKPYIKITDKVSGKTKTINMLDDVVGSFIYKTPLKGSIDMPDKVTLDEISIGVKGWFDQSSMISPEIKDVYWNISEAEKNKVQIGIAYP